MCTISITGVFGMLSGGILTNITVDGTATDCRTAQVSMVCQGVRVSVTVPVDPSGNWTAVFDSSVGFEEAECQCDGEIKVEAQCTDINTGALCTDSFEGLLPCEGTTTTTTTTTEPGCPDPVILGASVGDCNSDGTRTVTLSATPIGGSGPNARWDFGDASPPGPTFALTGGGTHFQMHDYAPGTFTATLIIDGCPDVTHTFTVPECPVGCPEVSVWAAPDTEDCLPGGLMNVALNTFNFGPATISAHWEFGDATPDGPSFTLPGGGHTENHNYMAPGTYTATLRIDGCPDESVTVNVPECPATTTTTTTSTTTGTTTTTTTTSTTTPPGDGDGGFCGSLLCCILCGIWSLMLAGYIVALATCALSDPIAIAIASAVLAAAGGFFISLCGVCAWARCTIVGVILGIIGAIIALIFSEGITVGCLIAAGSAALGFLLAALSILFLGDC